MTQWPEEYPTTILGPGVEVPAKSGGRKGRKPQELSWIDPRVLLKLGEVARHGADKYEDGNNYRRGYNWSLSFNAAQRHALQFWDGEDLDDESGLPHVLHAAWHYLALASFMMRNVGNDDRFKE